MESSVEERINAISENVTQMSISVSKLWETYAGGVPPHRITLNMMAAALIASVISSIFCILVAVELFYILQKVHTIYSLML